MNAECMKPNNLLCDSFSALMLVMKGHLAHKKTKPLMPITKGFFLEK